MAEPMGEFERLVSAVVTRFAAQKSRTIPAAQITLMARQLGDLVRERGLPPPLAEGERGAPGGMSEDVCAPLVGRVVAGTDEPLLADAARQLVKACFYPEFTECRDSYREVSPDGSCRRQELPRALGRVSGVHCVDCPHWVALPSAAHGELLEREWRGDPALLAEHCGVFMPEDFRALRHWLHAAARRR
jgi:hypothetical protein